MVETSKKKKQAAAASLILKIHAVQGEAESASHDTNLSIGGRTFKATSIESVLDIYKPLLKKHRLVILPVKTELIGSPANRDFIASYTYACCDVDTGESHEFNILSNGVDGGDKAAGKAATYALKYAYLQLFSGRRGEDPDLPQDEGQRKEKAAPAEEKKQAQKQPEKKEGRAMYDAGVFAMKERFNMKKIAESQQPPTFKEVNAFVKEQNAIIEKPEEREMLSAFGRFWWLCCLATGSPDMKEVEDAYAKAKAKLTKNNRDFIEEIIRRRQKIAETAKQPVEREPGEDG